VLRSILYLFLKRKVTAGWRKWRKEQLLCWHTTPHHTTPHHTIRITVIKCGRLKRKGHVTRMGDMRNACTFWSENLKEKAIWKTWMEYIKIYLKKKKV